MPLMMSPIDRRSMMRGVGLGAAAVPLLLAGVRSRAAAPSSDLKGVIRVCGTPQMGEMLTLWQKAFSRIYPEIFFDVDLQGTSTAQFGLQSGKADLALSGRRASDYEQYGIFRRSQYLTREVTVATGSYDKIGKSAALAVFVHRDNPIASLTIDQLDRIFGAERAGGWGTMEWDDGAARTRDANIRSWGQLGLKGEWAHAPITPYTPPAAHPGGVSFFQSRVMGGADTYNEASREYADRHALVAAMTKDRFSIGYASLGYRGPGVRTVPIAASDRQPAIALSRSSVASRAYPLARSAYTYLVPDTDVGDAAAIPPRVLAFLQFVLSSDGQRLVADTDYFSLPEPILREERSRLIAAPKVFHGNE